MKITVGHNRIIFTRPSDWESVSSQLVKEYGPSIMISWAMRRELGFTVRRHRGLVKWSELYSEEQSVDSELRNKFCYSDQVHLDFYSESALTYFLLKYGTVDT